VDPFTAPRETAEPAPVAVPLDWPAVYARRAAYGVYAAMICAGFASGAHPNGDVPMLATLAIGWAITYFCALDARAHNVVFPHSFWLITSLSWPVAPLVHLVRVRGAAGAITFVVHAVLIALCGVAGFALGTWFGNNW